MPAKKRRRKSSFPSQFKPRLKPKKYIVTIEDEYRRLKSVLEAGSLTEIRAYKKRTEDLLQYNFEFYSELAYQRSQRKEEITQALLLGAKKDLSLEGWHRAVKYRYGLHPLCAVGSMQDPGGRFNIGDIDKVRYQVFPALYFAQNVETAISELFAQDFVLEKDSKLSHFDYSLSKATDYSLVSVGGVAPTYFDLTGAKSLRPFIKVIQSFKFSSALITKAKLLRLAAPIAVKTESELMGSLLFSEWRAKSSFFDVPENCQIFGQLLQEAGIDGVLYTSKMKTGLNFALFSQNMAQSEAFVELKSELPHEYTPRRLDSSNYRLAEMTFEEILKAKSRHN